MQFYTPVIYQERRLFRSLFRNVNFLQSECISPEINPDLVTFVDTRKETSN